MKQSDEAVEKVLAGLGRVEISRGLAARVLIGAQGRVAMRSRSPFRLWRSLAPALGCGLILTVAGVLGWLHRPDSLRARPEATVGALGAPTLPNAGSRQTIAQQTIAQIPIAQVTIAQVTIAQVTPVHMRAAAQPMSRRIRRGRDQDSLARTEMRAPSMPPPPLPLTAQERLLLRIAHRGDPQELALLTPEMRLRQSAEGDAEFARFFHPSPVVMDQKP